MVHIVVVNVAANFQFLKNLNLDAEIVFLPCTGLKNPFRVLYMKFVLMAFRRKMALSSQDIVYFFAIFHDYVTGYLVQQAQYQAQVKLVDHYGYRPQAHDFGFLSKFFLKAVCLILNVNIRYALYQGRRYYYTVGDFGKIETPLVAREDFRKYFFYPEVSPTKRNILFYETNFVTSGCFQSYEAEILSVIQNLCRDFNVYVKGHPRLGLSQVVAESSMVHKVPQFIPGEFIELSEYAYVLGIDSAVIAHLALTEKNVFSLLPMFSIEENAKDVLRKYLLTKSGGKIKFIENLDALKA
ncbi:MAG: hypothetical protein ACKOX6_05640 [Bdellovibrio sp.]